MRQRLTYLLPEGSGVDPADIKVVYDKVEFSKASEASQEWQIKLGLKELPDELQDVLAHVHELHIRFASPWNDRLLPPLVSQVPSGFHAFFTPREAGAEIPICRLLQILLGDGAAKCHSVVETSSRPPVLSERFAMSSTYQYYQYLPLTSRMGEAILNKVCNAPVTKFSPAGPCQDLMNELDEASYVDIDFDVISHTFTLTALWSMERANPDAPSRPRNEREFRKVRPDDRLEIGILQSQKATEPEELSLGGYLTVVGEDEKPNPTMFSFPSRHHPINVSTPVTLQTSFQQPTGLHPKLELRFPRRHVLAPKDTCGLHAYMTLPSTLFIDRYQLSDQLFLESQNLVALRSLAGEQDLEAPDWVVKRWGSVALFQLATPEPHDLSTTDDWVVTVPLHLRYIDGPKLPTDEPGKATVEVPWPTVFWACDAEEGLKMSNNPFDRINLGYDGIFAPKTMFYHVPPAQGVLRTVAEIKVPVLNSQNLGLVQVGTLLAVAAGFAWVCWQLLKATAPTQRKRRKME